MGVSKAKGSVLGQSQDNLIVIPANTYFKIWAARNGMSFAATAIDHVMMQAQEEARMMPLVPPPEPRGRHLQHADLGCDPEWNQPTGAIAATVAVVSRFWWWRIVIMNIMLA